MATISIEAKSVEGVLPTTENFYFGDNYLHLYLVYKDDNGNEFVIRGGAVRLN